VHECIRANQVNDPPVLLPVPDYALRMGDNLIICLKAFDPDPYQKLTWEATCISGEMTLDTSGIIHWCANLTGTQKITVTVKDDSGSVSSTSFSLFV
jgi:hypothetical protein